MKLDIPTPNVETSGDFAEKLFGIGDAGIVFDILRSKLYSNPIAAVCREIASNGRDAMREAKKSDEPIHIQLPNSLDPNFKVKDFGVGISPDRVENIFIKYAASTKREDNTQTGAWGIGSKSPFAYSSDFLVITNYNGTQYHYSCVIDETRVGKLITLSKTPTDEPNGTTIVVPAKSQDYHLFSQYTEQATRHWNPRPIITGDSKFAWTETTKVLEGKNWAVASKSSYSYNDHIKLIIDGIEYPLDVSALRTYADCSLIDAIQGTLYLYFNNGDIHLSANREQVFLDKHTQEKIKAHLKEVKNEITQSVLSKIDAIPNLYEAQIYYRTGLLSSFYDTKFLGDLTWKGLPLSRYDYSPGCRIFHFSKGGKYGSTDKITRRDGRYIHFDVKTHLYLNDLPIKEPTANHVKKAFENNPDIKTVQVICPSETITVEKLNETINLDKMEPKLLSSIATASAKKSSGISYKTRMVCFKHSSGEFHQVRYDSIAEDATPIKVLCLLRKELGYDGITVVGRTIVTKTRSIDKWTFESFRVAFPEVSFYGVDEKTPEDRIEEDLSDLLPLEKFIEEHIVNDKSMDYVGVKYANTQRCDIDLIEHGDKFEKLIQDPESPFLQRLKAHKTLGGMADVYGNVGKKLALYEEFNHRIEDKDLKEYVKAHPEYDLKTFDKGYESKYPLLHHINRYSYSDKGVVEAMAQYINLIDSEKQNKKEEAA
jgi:hypothetical protein